MFTMAYRLGLIATFMLAFLATATAQTATQNIGNVYVSATAGAIFIDDLNITFSGAVVGSENVSFKPGAAITGAAGYHFTDYLAGEGELGYASADFDTATISTNILSGNFSVNGHANTVTGFANLIVTPLGHSTFTPYIGGGAGFAALDRTIDSVGGVAVNVSHSETDFAANLILGADVAVTDRWSVGGRYRFVWINSGNTQSSGGVTQKSDDITAHIITANATFHF